MAEDNIKRSMTNIESHQTSIVFSNVLIFTIDRRENEKLFGIRESKTLIVITVGLWF